ncbi:MAG: hypothetical protein Q4D85_01005 [Corynebacterium sp.]|uniref:hypothetical protein n=1 Tax=Corynebacterium sp. TaxID=1720 RepID=UPI0026DD748D|nr:hypothetical protein [Corynebacterium sp.]MDO5097306.1 hypothetical protein [Corynebacterium sp.]
MSQPYESDSKNRTAALIAAVVSLSAIVLVLALLYVFKGSEADNVNAGSDAPPSASAVASKSNNAAHPVAPPVNHGQQITQPPTATPGHTGNNPPGPNNPGQGNQTGDDTKQGNQSGGGGDGAFDPNKPPPAEVPDFLPPTARMVEKKPIQVYLDSWKHSRYYAGNDSTSDGFAQSVYNTFLVHLDQFDDGSVTFMAVSPETNYRYEMTCLDHGQFVACNGGYNAMVYIV